MSDDWHPGDRAECIDVSDIALGRRQRLHCGGQYLRIGQVYHVARVEIGGYGELVLEVGAEYGPKLARRFRKLPPASIETTRRREAEVV